MEAKTELPIARRLRRRTPSRVDFLYGEEGNKLINPDGLEAADIIEALVELAYQYRSDLLHPPSDDSRQRRIERIDAVLSRFKEPKP